ncbi:MAG: hypothetical protein Q9165_006497 [Trypethelium subeluteriae]
MSQFEGIYGITGICPPPDVKLKTKTIPYAPGMPLRYEITSIVNSKDPFVRRQWTLFVLALEKFKAIPVDKKLSYFQVAGIHGYPEIAWDNAPPPPPDPVNPGDGDNPNGGYCAHNTITFPTWHRPYMLLYEQRLWEIMIELVTIDWKLESAEAQEWTDAANQWRLPYWDWAYKQKYCEDFALPLVFTSPTVRIWPPQSVLSRYPTPKSYLNPLWGFDNPETDDDGNPLPLGRMPQGKEQYNIKDDIDTKHGGKAGVVSECVLPWSQTTGVGRYGIFISQNPARYTGLNGINNTSAVNNAFAVANSAKFWYSHPETGTIADSINRLFSPGCNGTWGLFASTKWNKENCANEYLSLEFIHNNVHNMTGGGHFATGVGHMADVPVAAFDPIFWLHHCNIDRLLAMWQALNWRLWWDKPEPPSSPPNVPDPLPTACLEPFHTKDHGDPAKDVWTSERCRDWTELHYQYDSLVPKPTAILPDGTLNEDQYKTDLASYINARYEHTITLVKHIKESDAIQTPDGLLKAAHDDQLVWEDYIINVQYDRYALNGRSYAIQFYLGSKANDDATVFSHANFLGQVYTFSGAVRENGGNCANCKSQADGGVLSRAQVPITIQLLHQATDDQNDIHPITSFVRDEVDEYLEKHLRWRFIALGGAERPAEDFPNTLISVWRGLGQRRQAEQDAGADSAPLPLPPSYTNYRPIHQATHGKRCGLQRDDA